MDALIRTIANALIRGSIYRSMRKVPALGILGLFLIGAVFYVLGGK